MASRAQEPFGHGHARRGTRPVYKRDPGGNSFTVPVVPNSITTYCEWVAYRAQRRGPRNPEAYRQLIEHDKTKHPAEGRYHRWLDWLPVGELYLSYAKGRGSD